MAAAFRLYVLCSTRAAVEAWRSRAAALTDLEIIPVHPVASATGTVHRIAGEAGQCFLVCRDEVYPGLGMGAQVGLLIAELDARFPNWALCGNRGVRWDGQHVYDFCYQIDRSGLQTAVCAHPVISLDDNLVLVNPRALNRHERRAPLVSGGDFGVVLSLESLLNGSLLAVSPRLMAMRAARDEMHTAALDSQAPFREYYRSSFLNHQLATSNGVLDLSEIVDYRYVAEPWAKVPQRDVLELYDRALAQARSASRHPSLTICCRTQFRRPEMLDRAVFSFGVFRQHAAGLAEVQVQLITDQPAGIAGPETERLQEAHPGAGLQCRHHVVRPGRHSRTDLLIAAIEHAETDAIWFVDDDDYANGPAGTAVARCLVADAPMVVVGSAAVVAETWSPPGPAASQLIGASRTSTFDAASVLRVLRGHNFTPICSMILPVPLMRERLSHLRALGNFNEDYFLLLLALTAPRVEVSIVDVELASISMRGDENTVAQKDMTAWRLSYAAFLLEVLNNPEGNSPFLWQVANAPPW